MSNSIDKFLENVARHDITSLEIINALQKMMIDESDTVRIEYILENGKESFDVPSLSHIIRRLERIDKNIRNIVADGEMQAYVVTQDGVRRQLINIKRFTPNEITITDDIISKSLYTRENLRGEKSTFIDIDISKQVEEYKYDFTHVQIKKLFVDGYDFSAGTKYENILKHLHSTAKKYKEQESIVCVKPRSRNITRDFKIADISQDGYLLDNGSGQNLSYTESIDGDVTITRSVSVGSKFTVGKNTLWSVSEIDKSTGYVRFNTVYGLEQVSIGDTIKIDIEDEFGTIVPVELHSSEPFILFIKPINQKWIASDEWGSCNVYVKPDVQVEEKINNLRGSSTKKDVYVKPNAPSLEAKNLQVKLINSHRINQFETKVREKYAEKENVKSQIEIIDKSIVKLKDEMGATVDKNLREKLQKSIDENYKQRKNLVSTFYSLVNDILTYTRDSEEFKPKYRIRGFFAIPDPTVYNGVSYDIIKFECQYRYLRTDNTESNVETIDYILPSGEKLKAYYSNWNTLPMNQREKIYNLATGSYEWKSENELDADSINPNQVDIPISKNEYVEIRVRSISEAGYPTVINMSEWSSPVIVEFPQHLVDTSSKIFEGIGDDNMLTMIEKELTSIGVYDHLSDSHTSGEKMFHHSARNISTDYFTDGENKQKSVMQILDELKRTIDSIESRYGIKNSPLQISILDSNEEKIMNIENNDHVKIFAGYYKNETESNSKGSIIQKTYYLSIRNPKSIDAELLSYVPGFNTPVTEDMNGYVHDEKTFGYRRYDFPCIGFKTDGEGEHRLPFGSPQMKGQFVYQRSRDLALQESIVEKWKKSTTGMNASEKKLNEERKELNFGDYTTTGKPETQFIAKIVDGKLVDGNGYLTDFCFHKDHPLFKNISGVDSEHKATIKDIIAKSVQSASFKSNSVKSIIGESSKIGFHHDDRYLVGKDTCGAYVYLSPQNPKAISTNTNIYNKGIIINNSEIRIPIIFECRMTDYYGDGSQGEGRVNGEDGVKNVVYEKVIGFDLIQKFIDDIFSFDITIKMKYQED